MVHGCGRSGLHTVGTLEARDCYRVIQWATGNVGKAAIRHFARNPFFDLAGVLVFDAGKVGMDAGEIAGIGPIGVPTTDDIDAIMGLDADCVLYAPIWLDVEAVCRLLRSGKNVVSTSGPFYRTEFTGDDFDRIEAACSEGNASFHGGGVHPGFAGDLLALTLARLSSSISTIHVYEVVDFGTDPSKYLLLMGMGQEPAEFASATSLLAASTPYFAQSMTEIVEGLGKQIDQITHEVAVTEATEDVAYSGDRGTDMPEMSGTIRKGTVAAQHHQWTAFVDGEPLVVFHAMYTMGDRVVGPDFQFGATRYRLVIEGEPPTELTLEGGVAADGSRTHPGYVWTAMDAANTIPAVVQAKAGVLTDFDLGVVQLKGL